MRLDLTEKSLPVYEALANPVRLEILRIISNRDLSITELSDCLNMSKAAVTKHIQKLEEAHLIDSITENADRGRKKIPHMAIDSLQVDFPSKIFSSYSISQTSVGVGNYVNFDVTPTCGLCSATERIGRLDDPTSFVDPRRVKASLIWFASGFVEYKIPMPDLSGKSLKLIEISMELGSEFPSSNNVWPSDIEFFINDIPIGVWTCPGDFSDVRGFYTPSWWGNDCSQYGILKHLRINEDNTSMDGVELSKVTISQLDLSTSSFISLKIGSFPDHGSCGGVTIFGKDFGNSPQDIQIRIYYN